MTAKGLARLTLAQLGNCDDEGWCILCRKKVGNWLACNDKHHAAHCAVHALRKAAK